MVITNTVTFKVHGGRLFSDDMDRYDGERVDTLDVAVTGPYVFEWLEDNDKWAWLLGTAIINSTNAVLYTKHIWDDLPHVIDRSEDEIESGPYVCAAISTASSSQAPMWVPPLLHRDRVLFSSMFRTSFSKIESLETKKLVLLMLLKLSTGWRPKRSSTAASVSKSPYYEFIKEFKVKALHIICTIDLVKETEHIQVLKIWDILPFHDIANLVTRLDGIIGTYTRDYINCCKRRCIQSGSEFPMKWPATTEIIQCKKGKCDDKMFMGGEKEKNYVETVTVRESLLLMKFYPLSTGAVTNMISGCDGGDLGLEFELTEQEKAVVSFGKSSFILGRSGTGKTTVLTMKLFQNEQLHHLACEGLHEVTERNEEANEDVLRQIFVTFSPKLCYAVKQHYGEWKRLTCGESSSSKHNTEWIGDIDKMMLSEDIPDHFLRLPHNSYPLIITFHRFLLMLDGTVGPSYFHKFPCVRKLINGCQSSKSRLDVLEQFMKFKDVTYKRFCSNYWPHLNNKLTKNLDPSSVFTEIMSVIKGQLTSIKAPNGILSRDDYISLSDGRVSIYPADKREIIYDIFCQYEKYKVENGNFDLADLVNDLHQRLEFEGYKGDMMDYVYIDEVQDLTMRQIMLFKHVCKNVHEGFAFSGDTAQAIAKGVGFRFEDIRCLFFSKFLMSSEKGKLSKMFHLSENFRTHAGVLNLAQSVIDLLCHFFPLFVDALGPETSQVGGDRPVLIETDTNYSAIKTIFGIDGVCFPNVTGFGAEQVVLVRDEYLKEKVVNIIGKNALVLTIMESKGLEFQDVLLYDFFTTSSFSNEWRIVYEYMNEKELLKSPSNEMRSSFAMEKHAVLCSELKLLYVAITRTRQRLWVCESSGFSQPIYDYWKMLSLVEVKPLSDLLADKMHIPSSKDDWKSRGIKLFHEHNYSMAHMCFLKAEDQQSEILARAYELREIANRTRDSHHKKKLFEDAVELFSSIDKEELAAECFYEMEDYKTAGDMYLRLSKLEKAGNCFYLAKCYKQAVDIYEEAGAYSKCLSACADGKLFEIGFEILARTGGNADMAQEFLQKGALYYLPVKDSKSMMKFVRCFRSREDMRFFLRNRNCYYEFILFEKEWGNYEEAAELAHKGASYYFKVNNSNEMMKCVRLFRSKGEMRNFLSNKECFDELIVLEKEWGNFEEAANVARRKHDPVLEADLLCLAERYRESSSIILWHVFSNSPIFRVGEGLFTQKDKDKLLKKAVSIAKRDSDVFHRFVCKAEKILSEGLTKEELLKKGLEFIYNFKESPLVANLPKVKKIHEIEKIEDDVIEKVYSILKPENRLGELLLLQESHWKFVEAAKICDENDRPIDSALRRLWYVFFGSLWAHGTSAWPLKNFKQKNKLLCDANSYVEYHLYSQEYAMVRAEINVLSNVEIDLSQMWRYLMDVHRERSFRLHFLVSRRILDVHLDSCDEDYAYIETCVENGTIERIEYLLSNEIVSVEGLVYFWKYWKGLICELLNWNVTQNLDGNKVYNDFVFNYFGLRKFNVDSYVVLNSKSEWVKRLKPCMIKKEYLYIIRAPELSYVVSQYWCSELLSVAVEVLQKLKALHSYSTEKDFSIHQQTNILTSLFEVTKSIHNCKFPNVSSVVNRFYQPCVDLFLGNVFHIDWKYAQSKEMIHLRGNDAFRNIFSEAINVNSKLQKGITCGHLARMAMIFLGSNVIGFNDDTEKKLTDVSSIYWRDLLSKLNGGKSSLKSGDLAIMLHNALKETFTTGWRVMSPACLLYLMERLLILSFCVNGNVFTTRSSCVEWLNYEESGLNIVSATFLDTMKTIHHSLASMVGEMLNSRDVLMRWVTRSEESSCTIVVLRLVVLLSLICLNSGRYYYQLLDLLRRGDIVSFLPPVFCETLIKGIKEERLVDAVAVACKQIENPLVVVMFNEDFPKEQCQNAIYLNMKKVDFGRETLLEMLYSEKREADSTSCN
ncbi:uncharacterized protein [Rutidosis leptorrhynchoides]|uniref:uncharacterized protein n=1 Tax=Rutidosis leptorrhynchoides TaxID=125765 RepID=UPI003A9A0E69